MYVGWDWASEAHDISVVDDAGELVDHFAFPHTEAGLKAALKRLARHGSAGQLTVCIERPNGLAVERLLQAGHPVAPVHPNSFNAARARWGASGAKSDPGDSYRLADYLRTDGHRLRRVKPVEESTASLQALVRARADQVEARVAATNQLQALLQAHWPGAEALFDHLDSNIALSFLDEYPTPERAERLGEQRMARFLHRHAYSGSRSASQLLRRLREAPVAPSRLDLQVLSGLVQAQVAVLRALLQCIQSLERSIRGLLAEHPKTALLASLPRIGDGVNLAQVIAEVGPILDRCLDVEHAAAEAGAAPVTKASGKARVVSFRWAANTRARQALQLWVNNSRYASPWAAQMYARAIADHKSHPHAIRILMRAWLRVLWACWHSGMAYDPARHAAAIRRRAA